MTTTGALPPPPPPPEVTIQPPAAEWRSLIARHAPTDSARRFRAELGLPTDRPVIMTGHQAEWWHPGIVAKFFAADSAARALGAAAAWLVVDQDDPPADTSMRWPARDAEGRLVVHTADLLDDTRSPVASDRSIPNGSAPFPFVEQGLRRIRSAWEEAAREKTAPRRVAAALKQLISPYTGPAAVVFGSGLSQTALFGRIVEAMTADPAGCGDPYNAAARAHPSAGIRPLVADEVQDRYELPLWHLPADGGPRRRVYAETVAAIPIHELAPRALLLTGLLRLAACDLFIHGTGGGGGGGDAAHEGYDRVTEDWFAGWARAVPAAAAVLHRPLAPATVVTATMRLPLIGGPSPRSDEVARARWAAHHARHEPSMLGDAAAAQEKRRLVTAIAAAPRHSQARRARFAELHALLDRFDRAHADDLDGLDDHARQAARRVADWSVAADRTWPFPLYPEPALRSLRARIEAAFTG